MIEALKTAPDDAGEFRRTVRWNLGAWLGQVHKPLRIFDAAAGQCPAFSPDGSTFATSHVPADRSNVTPILLREIASGRRLSASPGVFGPFAFRPDGQALVGTADNGRRMVAVDVTTGRVLWTTKELPGEPGTQEMLCFSPDGSTLFLDRNRLDGKSYESAGLMRLDVVTGQQRGETMRGWGWIAVAPDGETAATRRIENGELYIEIYDMPSGRRKACWPAGRQGPNWELFFSPDGKSLFVQLSGDEGVTFNRDGYGQILERSHRTTDQSAHGRHDAPYLHSCGRSSSDRE